MKFFIDMPLSPSLCQWLKAHGHEADHAFATGMATASDMEILKRARREESIVITADLDFPRLIALAGESAPPLILFRGGNYSEEEMKKTIIVVDKTRIRRRSLPIC